VTSCFRLKADWVESGVPQSTAWATLWGQSSYAAPAAAALQTFAVATTLAPCHRCCPVDARSSGPRSPRPSVPVGSRAAGSSGRISARALS
jgi:hypothetical protein